MTTIKTIERAEAAKATGVTETTGAMETTEIPDATEETETVDSAEATEPAETRFFVYMLRCRDDSLYTGQTKDLENRLRQHAEGKGAKYVRGRRPVKLAYVEEVASRSDALKREYALRKLTKAHKELLVRQFKER